MHRPFTPELRDSLPSSQGAGACLPIRLGIHARDERMSVVPVASGHSISYILLANDCKSQASDQRHCRTQPCNRKSVPAERPQRQETHPYYFLAELAKSKAGLAREIHTWAAATAPVIRPAGAATLRAGRLGRSSRLHCPDTQRRLSTQVFVDLMIMTLLLLYTLVTSPGLPCS
jgi:hypothetical protein